jgi:hypothetical protein
MKSCSYCAFFFGRMKRYQQARAITNVMNNFGQASGAASCALTLALRGNPAAVQTRSHQRSLRRDHTIFTAETIDMRRTNFAARSDCSPREGFGLVAHNYFLHYHFSTYSCMLLAPSALLLNDHCTSSNAHTVPRQWRHTGSSDLQAASLGERNAHHTPAPSCSAGPPRAPIAHSMPWFSIYNASATRPTQHPCAGTPSQTLWISGESGPQQGAVGGSRRRATAPYGCAAACCCCCTEA